MPRRGREILSAGRRDVPVGIARTAVTARRGAALGGLIYGRYGRPGGRGTGDCLRECLREQVSWW